MWAPSYHCSCNLQVTSAYNSLSSFPPAPDNHNSASVLRPLCKQNHTFAIWVWFVFLNVLFLRLILFCLSEYMYFIFYWEFIHAYTIFWSSPLPFPPLHFFYYAAHHLSPSLNALNVACITGTGGEPIAITLLKEHSQKLPPKFLSLYR